MSIWDDIVNSSAVTEAANWLRGKIKALLKFDLGWMLTRAGREAVKTYVMTKYMVDMNETYGVVLLATDEGFFRITQMDFSNLSGMLSRYGFSKFKMTWRIARQLVPLRGRLLLEQVFWDMGPPWSSLVTGFLPIDAHAGTSKTGTKGGDVGQTKSSTGDTSANQASPWSGGQGPPKEVT